MQKTTKVRIVADNESFSAPESAPKKFDALVRHARLAYVVSRPFIVLYTLLKFAYTRSFGNSSFGARLGLLVRSAVVVDFLRAVFDARAHVRAAGSLADKLTYTKGTRIARILEADASTYANFLNRHASWATLGLGDFTTLLPAAYRAEDVSLSRTRKRFRVHYDVMESDDDDAKHDDAATKNDIERVESRSFAVDHLCHKSPRPTSKAVVIVSGIGGDSRSTYVQDFVSALWNAADDVDVFVPLAKGMREDVVARVDCVFSFPNAVKELEIFVDAIDHYDDVVLVGYSLGALLVHKFLQDKVENNDESTPHEKRHSRIKGALCVSGGFSVDFMETSHYETVYQPIIVHGLVRDVLSKYAHALDESVVRNLENSTSYAQLYEAFFRPNLPHFLESASNDSKPPTAHTFADWKAEMTTEKVVYTHVPTLFVASTDDPLHRIDAIGLEKLGAPDGDRSNLAVLLTSSGGHVSWTSAIKDINHLKDESSIHALAVTFVRSCFAHSRNA